MTSLLCLACLIGISASPNLEGSSVEDEIIVTGERIPRTLSDTPSSVIVETGETIDERAAYDRLDQLLAEIPNVQPGSGAEGVTVRGQDSTGVLRELFAFLGATRPRITLQVDGRAASYYEYVNGAISIWDVERVEIFRSPQTTTQGRNSIAGAIFVNTRDPTYVWEARARIIVGEIETRHASVVLSGPLVGDQLAFRIAGDVRLGRMASDMADAVVGADIDRDDQGLLRVKLLAEPRALPGTRLETSFVHTQSQAPQFEATNPPFEQRRAPLPVRTNGVYRTNIDSLTAIFTYPFSRDLTATTTFSWADSLIRRFSQPGLGQTRVDTEDGSFETSLVWQPDGPVSLLGGVHMLRNRQRQFIDISGPGIAIGTGTFRDRQASLGLFGEATWRPTAPLTITAGLRYQHDRQDRAGQIGPVPAGITLDYGESFDAWLPKVTVAYDIADGVTAGLMVQRAYNPGGTSISLRTRRQDSFEAETLWNYEAFLRASFAGGAASLSANLFYNDISDAQRQQTVAIPVPGGSPLFVTEFANAPSAESYGAELQLDWRPNRRLELRLGLGLLETELRRTLLPRDPTLGKDFERAPNFTAAATLGWRPTSRWHLSASLRANGDYFSDDANSPARRIDGYTVLNARAAYTHGRVTLFGYVRNALDNFYLTYLFPPVPVAAPPSLATAGDPREFGVGIDFGF